jgi:hypothetical protein
MASEMVNLILAKFASISKFIVYDYFFFDTVPINFGDPANPPSE